MNADVSLLLLRLCLAAIFPISAYGKITGWPKIVDTVANAGVPQPYIASLIGVTAEAVLPILLVVGIGTRWAAIGLLIYTAAASLIGHPFWRVPSPEVFMNLASFLKNLGLMAGFLVLAALGPGRLAVQPTRITVYDRDPA